MKKALLTIAIMLLMSAVASAGDFCIWSLADSDSVIARVGYKLGDNIEAGIESAWRHDSERPGQLWALFGVYKAPDAIKVGPLLPFDWLPELTATPYIGASVGVDLENEDERTVAGPLAGLIIQDILVVEYFYGFVSDDLDAYMNDGYKLRIGLHIEF